MNALNMDGYGIYVWSCFILTILVFVICDWQARARQKRVYRNIEVRIKALENRR